MKAKTTTITSIPTQIITASQQRQQEFVCIYKYIQMVATDFSRSRENEPSISGTFVRLNVLDYKRAGQSDHKERSCWDSIELRQVVCSKFVRI